MRLLCRSYVSVRTRSFGRAKLRQRSAVEHTLAHLGQWQGDRARYTGLRKNLFDLRRVAVVHNLHVIARLSSSVSNQQAFSTLGKNLSKMQAPWSRGGVLPRSKTVLSAVKPPRDPPRQLPILRALFDEGACYFG